MRKASQIGALGLIWRPCLCELSRGGAEYCSRPKLWSSSFMFTHMHMWALCHANVHRHTHAYTTHAHMKSLRMCESNMGLRQFIFHYFEIPAIRMPLWCPTLCSWILLRGVFFLSCFLHLSGEEEEKKPSRLQWRWSVHRSAMFWCMLFLWLS